MEQLPTDSEVFIHADQVVLPGTLLSPPECHGVVIFAHGSGSSRHSRRNRAVAQSFVERGCGALLFDLLSPREALDRKNVFDIELLGRRVVCAGEWLRLAHGVGQRPFGYFGASTGGAAALVAAAQPGSPVAAVVSRGGRPDLAGDALAQVAAPTLLIVGSLDREVLELNRQAQRRLRCENDLTIIEGATHLFEEPGTLEAVAEASASWFFEHFVTAPHGGVPTESSR